MPERNLLTSKDNAADRKRIMAIARAEIGVTETTGNNDGIRVEEYLAAVGLHRGDPYCAAFVSWVFKAAGFDQPRTGWSPSLFPAHVLVATAAPGHVFGIYFPSLKRIAHCGLVAEIRNDWIGTVEANTNINGNRDGNGVHKRLRHVRTVKHFADWTWKGGAK